jgi:hypothetical protein
MKLADLVEGEEYAVRRFDSYGSVARMRLVAVEHVACCVIGEWGRSREGAKKRMARMELISGSYGTPSGVPDCEIDGHAYVEPRAIRVGWEEYERRLIADAAARDARREKEASIEDRYGALRKRAMTLGVQPDGIEKQSSGWLHGTHVLVSLDALEILLGKGVAARSMEAIAGMPDGYTAAVSAIGEARSVGPPGSLPEKVRVLLLEVLREGEVVDSRVIDAEMPVARQERLAVAMAKDDVAHNFRLSSCGEFDG